MNTKARPRFYFAVRAGSELGPLESSRHHSHREQTSKEKLGLPKHTDPRHRIAIQVNGLYRKKE